MVHEGSEDLNSGCQAYVRALPTELLPKKVLSFFKVHYNFLHLVLFILSSLPFLSFHLFIYLKAWPHVAKAGPEISM